MKQLVEDIFSPDDRPPSQVPTHEIDELLLLSSWIPEISAGDEEDEAGFADLPEPAAIAPSRLQ